MLQWCAASCWRDVSPLDLHLLQPRFGDQAERLKYAWMTPDQKVIEAARLHQQSFVMLDHAVALERKFNLANGKEVTAI